MSLQQFYDTRQEESGIMSQRQKKVTGNQEAWVAKLVTRGQKRLTMCNYNQAHW